MTTPLTHSLKDKRNESLLSDLSCLSQPLLPGVTQAKTLLVTLCYI